MIDCFKSILKRVLPKKVVLKYRASKMLGYSVNIDSPTTFNEKIQWKKLNDKREIISLCADKVAARDYVSKRIGDKYLIPIHSVFNSYKDIDYDKLPQTFALKAAHGSAWNIICKDKQLLDSKDVYSKVKEWGKSNYYWIGYEYAYKAIPPRFICEKLILDKDGECPNDYKIFCFNGEPHLIQVDLDRFSGHNRVFYNLDWVKQDFTLGFPGSELNIAKPNNLSHMINIARALSTDFDFVRIDLYNIEGRIYFGEMTFYPGEGTEKFTPEKWDRKFGDLINVTKISQS